MTANNGRGWRPRPSRRKLQPKDFRLHFVSQNVQGLKADKEEELVALMKKQGVFVSCLQETWCEGESLITERAGHTFVRTRAIRSAARGRASGGLAIVLSSDAKRAWDDSGQ